MLNRFLESILQNNLYPGFPGWNGLPGSQSGFLPLMAGKIFIAS
jgi:hypothetical protein